MLDAAFIRANLDAVEANCVNRNVPQANPERVVQLDDARKNLVHLMQEVQQRQNEISKLIPREKDSTRKQQLIAEGKDLRGKVGELEKQLTAVEEQLHAELLVIPNMTHPDAPVGREA